MATLPTLADMEQVPTDDAVADPKGTETIAHISKVGANFLVTFTDGREVELHPGDQIRLGPVTPDTTYSEPGQEPDSLHELYHTGQLPASFHAMIEKPDEESAADAGLVTPPVPQLPDMGDAPDAEDLQDGGVDEAQEGDAAPDKGPAKKPTLPGM